MERHRNLGRFVRWFLSQPLGALRPPQIPSMQLKLATVNGEGASVTGVVLHRDGQYQVEQFTVHPSEAGVRFPEHRHPNVESVEFFMSGEIAFAIAGRRVARDEDIRARGANGEHALAGSLLLVRSRDWHGGDVGAMGGTFLSLQRWRAGVAPSSVVLDWIGPPHVSVRS